MADGARWREGRTVVFAVSSDAEAPGFDSRKTESDGLAQRGGVNVWDAILVTNAPIRKVQALPWHIPVGVGSVIGREPECGRG